MGQSLPLNSNNAVLYRISKHFETLKFHTKQRSWPIRLFVLKWLSKIYNVSRHKDWNHWLDEYKSFLVSSRFMKNILTDIYINEWSWRQCSYMIVATWLECSRTNCFFQLCRVIFTKYTRICHLKSLQTKKWKLKFNNRLLSKKAIKTSSHLVNYFKVLHNCEIEQLICIKEKFNESWHFNLISKSQVIFFRVGKKTS